MVIGLAVAEELPWDGTGGGSSRMCVLAGGGGLGEAIKLSREALLSHERGDDSISLVRSMLSGGGNFNLLFEYDRGGTDGSCDGDLSWEDGF